MSSSKAKSKKWLFYGIAVIIVILLDQGLKAWVCNHIPLNASSDETISLLPGIVHLTHINNAGAAFGMMQGKRIAFLCLLLAFCVFVVIAIAKKWISKPWECWLAVIAMGSAISNGIDRAVNGYVVDMFEVEFMNFAIFNLADIFMVVCCIVFVLLTLFSKEHKEAELMDAPKAK